jgi:hypothetical protein
MRYRDDFNPGRTFTADDQERESPQAEYAAPARGRLQNCIYSLIEFYNELIADPKAPSPIPLNRRSQFLCGFRVKTGALSAHPFRGLIGIAIRSRE